MFNVAVEIIKKPNGNQEISRYTSTNQFLKSYKAESDSRGKFAKKRATLNVSVKIIGSKRCPNKNRHKVSATKNIKKFRKLLEYAPAILHLTTFFLCV